jgi:hypothetical protein
MSGQLEALAERQRPVQAASSKTDSLLACQDVQIPEPFQNTPQHFPYLPEKRLSNLVRPGTVRESFSSSSTRDAGRRFIYDTVVPRGANLTNGVPFWRRDRLRDEVSAEQASGSLTCSRHVNGRSSAQAVERGAPWHVNRARRRAV